MKLKDISDIQSGYITRGKVPAVDNGSHYLVQAKDIDARTFRCRAHELLRFNPERARAGQVLRKDDLIFMAKGAHNVTVLAGRLPEPALAAACFFIVRASAPDIVPGYLCWYLNQAPVTRYLLQNSGRGVHMPVVRRAVLENIDVPVPDLETQVRIADLSALMLKEIELLRRLGEKRRQLITAACLQAVNNN